MGPLCVCLCVKESGHTRQAMYDLVFFFLIYVWLKSKKLYHLKSLTRFSLFPPPPVCLLFFFLQKGRGSPRHEGMEGALIFCAGVHFLV